MPSSAALRFAQSLFDEHCHEGTFDVEVLSSDLYPLAEAFEELGCETEVQPFRNRLTVVCPEGQSER